MNNPANHIVIALLATTVIFLILAGFGIAFTVIHKKKRQKHREELKLKDLNFQKELLSSQVEIQEKTLETISQEVHDNIGQVLSASVMNLRQIKVDNTELQDEINGVAARLAVVIGELRSLSHRLSTERILEIGLVEAIEFEVSMIKRDGLKISFEVRGRERKIVAHKELILFRIIQECIANALKHADAAKITIRASYEEDAFYLEIRDDGKGYDTGEKTGGIGIRNIYNRSRLIGAETVIGSSRAEGTAVSIKLYTN